MGEAGVERVDEHLFYLGDGEPISGFRELLHIKRVSLTGVVLNLDTPDRFAFLLVGQIDEEEFVEIT